MHRPIGPLRGTVGGQIAARRLRTVEASAYLPSVTTAGRWAFIAERLVSTRSDVPRSNGSMGSTIIACSNPSVTSRLPTPTGVPREQRDVVLCLDRMQDEGCICCPALHDT